jgi:hypothetical protein
MPELLNVKQLLGAYPDEKFRKELFRLYNINDFLSECIIADGYKVPQDLFQPIVLTAYGNDVYLQLRKKNVGHAEAYLLCFLQFTHIDLLIDVEKTDREAIVASLHRQILESQIVYAFPYGRMLYDKFADLFPSQVQSYLSLTETFQLLRDTPQGVYQSVDLVSGPFGLLRSASDRWLSPDRSIPLRHCEDFSCNVVHEVSLSTSRTADINRHRETMRDVLKHESEHGSEWGPFLRKIAAPYVPKYKDSGFDPVVLLIGDAIVDDELRNLTEWLFEHSDDRVRQAASSVGLQGSPKQIVRELDRAQMMQLMLTADDNALMSAIDTLVQRGTIVVPPGETRTAVVNGSSRFGRYGLRAKLGEFGVCIDSSITSIAPLRTRRLVEQMYLLDKVEDRQELEWQLRREQGESLEAKLEHYIQTKQPRDVLKNLVLTRRSNVIVAMQHLMLIDGADESDEVLLNSVLWKLGFEVVDPHASHEKFWNLHRRMLQHTRSSPVESLDAEIEEVRGTAANYFTELEGVLDDSLAYITWALTSDHYVNSKPFTYRPEIDRTHAFGLLSETGRRQSRPEKLVFSERNTLYPLMRGFALLAQILHNFEGRSEELVRSEEQLPPWVGVQSLQRFPFMHTVPFLDLLEGSRASIIEALKEVSAMLVASEISDARNEWLHGRRTMANVDRLRFGLEKVGEAINRITESGFSRDRYYWVRNDADGDGRRTAVLANSSGRKVTLFRPSQFQWLGLPRLSDSWYVVHTARFAEPSEVLRFGVEFDSPYANMWANYPRRPSESRSVQGLGLGSPSAAIGDLLFANLLVV